MIIHMAELPPAEHRKFDLGNIYHFEAVSMHNQESPTEGTTSLSMCNALDLKQNQVFPIPLAAFTFE